MWRPTSFPAVSKRPSVVCCAGCRVIALDLPGHGESGKHLQNGDAQELSQAVLDLLDHLDLARVHLAGHSMGGLVSLTVAGQALERVASLTLIGSWRRQSGLTK